MYYSAPTYLRTLPWTDVTETKDKLVEIGHCRELRELIHGITVVNWFPSCDLSSRDHVLTLPSLYPTELTTKLPSYGT